MNPTYNFIIVDDEAISNKLCRKVIEKSYDKVDIMDFTNPLEGLGFVAKRYSDPGTEDKAILLLDINMPEMDAWGFLEQFETLGDHVKNRVKIYILSSSVNKDDMVRANAHKHVEYYLIKPLTRESVKLIVHVLERRSKGS